MSDSYVGRIRPLTLKKQKSHSEKDAGLLYVCGMGGLARDVLVAVLEYYAALVAADATALEIEAAHG